VSPELFITVLHDIIGPIFVLQVSTDKAVNRIGKLLNRSVIFLYSHKTLYNTKTDETGNSYKGKYPLTLWALPLEGGENYLF
jgi:hypothetical protein